MALRPPGFDMNRKQIKKQLAAFITPGQHLFFSVNIDIDWFVVKCQADQAVIILPGPIVSIDNDKAAQMLTEYRYWPYHMWTS